MTSFVDSIHGGGSGGLDAAAVQTLIDGDTIIYEAMSNSRFAAVASVDALTPSLARGLIVPSNAPQGEYRVDFQCGYSASLSTSDVSILCQFRSNSSSAWGTLKTHKIEPKQADNGNVNTNQSVAFSFTANFADVANFEFRIIMIHEDAAATIYMDSPKVTLTRDGTVRESLTLIDSAAGVVPSVLLLNPLTPLVASGTNTTGDPVVAGFSFNADGTLDKLGDPMANPNPRWLEVGEPFSNWELRISNQLGQSLDQPNNPFNYQQTSVVTPLAFLYFDDGVGGGVLKNGSWSLDIRNTLTNDVVSVPLSLSIANN